MKRYNEFTPAEQIGIKELNNIYIMAEYADRYSDTLREKSKGLERFNKKYGYNFKSFEFNFNENNLDKTYFL